MKAARWVTAADPSGLLYGAIVSGAVLVTVNAHASSADRVVVTTSVFLVTYWMAHVYIGTLSTQLRGDTRAFFPRLGTAARKETGVLKGGLPAIVVYSLGYLLGLDKPDAAALAAYFTVGLLMVVGYLGAHAAGLRGRIVVGEVAAAAFFGVLIVIGKSLLH